MKKCLCGHSSQVLWSGSEWRSKISRLDSGESSLPGKRANWGAQKPSPILGLMASRQVEGQASPIPAPPWRTLTLHHALHILMSLEIHSFHRSLKGRACISHLFPSPDLGTHIMSSCCEQSTVVGLHSGTGCSGSAGLRGSSRIPGRRRD